VRLKLRNHADPQPVKRFKRCDKYTISNFGMLQLREKDFSAHTVWWYCAVAQLRAEGTLLLPSSNPHYNPLDINQ